MKNNVAYLRVSTEAQTEKYGLDVQRQKITDYCEKNGVKIDKWYIDGGYSGSKLERPEIQELLSDAEKGQIKTVYIYKLDRMSRDVIDTLNLMYKVLPAYGVNVVSMTEEIRTENPMDKVMLTMNAAMSQYEREVIRMRMSAGMVERVKNGYWKGGGNVPYGYRYDRNDGILHPHKEEAENVRKVYRMYIDGYSCEKISEILGLKGDLIITNIIKRKTNIGLLEFNGNVYKGLHEPIVDEATYYEAQECMERRANKSYAVTTNLLTGLCYCGCCGGRMRYQKWGVGRKLLCYAHYKSSKKYMKKIECCDNPVVDADQVDRQVEENFLTFIQEYSQNDSTDEISREKMLEKQIEKSKSKIKKFYNMYADNDSENLLELAKEEESRLSDLKSKLEDEKRNVLIGKNKDLEKAKSGAKKWDDLPVDKKNIILKGCVDKILIKGSEISVFYSTF